MNFLDIEASVEYDTEEEQSEMGSGDREVDSEANVDGLEEYGTSTTFHKFASHSASLCRRRATPHRNAPSTRKQRRRRRLLAGDR
jgi:hypothetical protein